MTIEQVNIAFSIGKIPYKVVNKNNPNWIVYTFGSSKEHIEKRYSKNWNHFEVSIEEFKEFYVVRTVANVLMKTDSVENVKVDKNVIFFQYTTDYGKSTDVKLTVNDNLLTFESEYIEQTYTMESVSGSSQNSLPEIISYFLTDIYLLN